MRVTGAQSLAAHGLEIAKIKFLARRSSQVIERYVSDAPLTSLRSDLGLPSNPHTFSKPIKLMESKMLSVEDQLALHDARIIACESRMTTETIAAPQERLIQNIPSQVVHQIRHGTQATTVCGWQFDSQLRLGNITNAVTPLDVEWWLVCDKCMQSLRAAQRIAACEEEQPSD